MISLRLGFYLFSAIVACCAFVSATSLPQDSLKEIFETHSGLAPGEISEATFSDFKFDIGTTKDAKIVRTIRGGMSLVKWGEDEKSFVAINAFAQRLYDNYTQEMDVPIDIIKGISSANSTAALGSSGLRKSWKIGTLENVGSYCVGELRGGLAGNSATTGYFLDEEYGFCLQISTLKGSGVELKHIEEIGKALITEMKVRAKSENITPNPLSKGGPLVADEPRAPKEKRREPTDGINIKTPSDTQKDHIIKSPKRISAIVSSVVVGFLVLLLAIVRIWKNKQSKQTPK